MKRDYKTEFSGVVAEISNFLAKKNVELTEIMTAARKSMDDQPCTKLKKKAKK
jgi:hypothetical protein